MTSHDTKMMEWADRISGSIVVRGTPLQINLTTEYAYGEWKTCKVCEGWGCFDAKGYLSCQRPEDTVLTYGRQTIRAVELNDNTDMEIHS